MTEKRPDSAGKGAPVGGSENHEPSDFNGRTVCTCGDFNCASLDTPLTPGIGDA